MWGWFVAVDAFTFTFASLFGKRAFLSFLSSFLSPPLPCGPERGERGRKKQLWHLGKQIYLQWWMQSSSVCLSVSHSLSLSLSLSVRVCAPEVPPLVAFCDIRYAYAAWALEEFTTHEWQQLHLRQEMAVEIKTSRQQSWPIPHLTSFVYFHDP